MNNLVVFSNPLFESTPVLRCNWSITFSRRRYTISNENIEQCLSLAGLSDIRENTFEVWAICRLFHFGDKGTTIFCVFQIFIQILFADIEMPAGRKELQEVLQVSRLKIDQKPHCQAILDATCENFLENFR